MDGISINQTKFVNSLRIKKYRYQHGLFIVEGDRGVTDLLTQSTPCRFLFALPEWFKKRSELCPPELRHVVNERELQKISALSTPNQVLGVFEMPVSNKEALWSGSLIFAFDKVRDPGNLGTILRIADWFALSGVLLSEESADPYNSKVVQSSMGSVGRVRHLRGDLKAFLEEAKQHSFQVVAADLGGEVLQAGPPSKASVVLFGNEAHGISPDLEPFIDYRLSIAGYGQAESLNLSVAAGIFAWALKA